MQTSQTPEQTTSKILGVHNPFNNLWIESDEVLLLSEAFAREALHHIAAKANTSDKSNLGEQTQSC